MLDVASKRVVNSEKKKETDPIHTVTRIEHERSQKDFISVEERRSAAHEVTRERESGPARI
jgi:hypothetical protein